MKRLFYLFLCVLLLSALTACNGGGTDPIETDPAESQEIESTEESTEAQDDPKPAPTAVIHEKVIYMFSDSFHEINYSVSRTNGLPDGDAEEIVWTSSDEWCAGVKNGRVYARREGYAVISGGGDTFCTVRVISRRMPTISIDTGGALILSNESYTACYVSVDSRNTDYCFEKAKAGIRLRGNSTFNANKKPYRLKFVSSQSILGMNEDAECKSWVLLADRYDNSMVRNATCLSLASAIVDGYTSDWRYVALEINGEPQGVYLLAEQPQIHEERVNIEEAGEASDLLRSGYLAELNCQSPRPAFKIKTAGMTFRNFLGRKAPDYPLVYDLKNNNVSNEQKAFVGKYFQNVFTLIYEATYNNTLYELNEEHELVLSDRFTSAEEAISSVIDVDSFVRMYILTELICNHDAYQKSMYQHVDFSEGGTGLLTFSCPWDFDFTMYRFEDLKYYDPEAYLTAERVTWFVMMMNHGWFRAEVQALWNQITSETNHFEQPLKMILALTDEYGDEFIEDGELWGREELQTECADTVYEWLQTRIAWLDEQFGEGTFGGKGIVG